MLYTVAMGQTSFIVVFRHKEKHTHKFNNVAEGNTFLKKTLLSQRT